MPPLLELLAELADPRGRRGPQYPVPALLGLTLVALLAGRHAAGWQHVAPDGEVPDAMLTRLASISEQPLPDRTG